MIGRRIALMVLAMVLALNAAGCVAAAAAGAAAGAGGYAWASGKLTFTTAHPVGETHSAVLSAFEDLEIELRQDRVSTVGGTVKGLTAANETVTIDLAPLARDITDVEIRVGFWGNQYKEAKIAEAIERHLR